MRWPFLGRVEWLFPLRGRWLRYLIQGLLGGCTLGLWGACLFRAARFWFEAETTYLTSGDVDDFADLNWARVITASYALCSGIGLGLLVTMRCRGGAFLGFLHTVNLLVAAWLTLERPERGMVHTFEWEPLQALAINLLPAGIAGTVGLVRAVARRRRRLRTAVAPID